MVAGCGEQIGGLFLAAWWLPEQTCDGVGVCRFGDFGEFYAALWGGWVVGVGGLGTDGCFEDLDL